MPRPCRRNRALLPISLALGVAACSGHSEHLAAESELVGVCPSNARELNIVAHQDDDLLFLNPEISDAIGAGRCTRTVYVTAGDAGQDEAYWSTREAGIRTAYARMAGVADQWRSSRLSLGGHAVRVEALVANARVSLIFLRLPDGSDAERYHHETIAKLWSGQIGDIGTVDGADRFDRAGLVETLRDAMTSYSAAVIRTLDATDRPGDHVDHHHAALFAHQANTAYAPAHELRSFRGYTMEREALNLDEGQRREKWRTFMTYAVHDRQLCAEGTDMETCSIGGGYPRWAGQLYRAEPPALFPGALAAAGLKCLDIPDARSSNGTAVQLWDCVDVPQQRWRLLPDGHVVGLEGKCLDVRGGSIANGTPVQIWDCADVAAQKWQLGPDQALRAFGTKCLDVRDAVFVNGTAVQLWDCAEVPAQRWVLEAPRL